ncbi:SH3 domain-containing protein [Enterobacter wuhouensis]|uniref:SH3 domain-containing protein n=1 Tax=Enterobacter wuhouensis TaxID=2529381 RepID=UPI002FD54DDB
MFSGSSARQLKLQHEESGIATALKQLEPVFGCARAASRERAIEKLQESYFAGIFGRNDALPERNFVEEKITKQLDKLKQSDIQMLSNAALIYSRTPHGAAVIASNPKKFEGTATDAISELKQYVNETTLVKNFRKLPLLIQVLIIHMFFTIGTVTQSKIESAASYLVDKTYEYIVSERSSAKSVNTKIKEINSYGLDRNALKKIRIITHNNVRLRNSPSMKGKTLLTMEQYTSVVVIDKSNKNWLFVKISSGEQEVSGWVNRAYTRVLVK